MDFREPARTIDEQLDLLKVRGLTVDDDDRARHWLRRVGYHRLGAYGVPFTREGRFAPGTCFDQLADLYMFDRRLRLLVLDAIEPIEVAIRAAVTHELARAFGPFAHVAATNFAPTFDHARFLRDVAVEEARTEEASISEFRRTHPAEDHVPVWLATELMSFGTVSVLFRALPPWMRQGISREYGVDAQFLASWLHVLSYIRNVCAHHRRLWNRELAVKPRFPSRSRGWPHRLEDNGRVHAVFVVLRHMLGVVSPDSGWRERLFGLLAEYAIDESAMGFSRAWRTTALWR